MRFAATFSPGFEGFIAEALGRELGSPPQSLKVSGGMVRFTTTAPLAKVVSAPSLASVFVLLREFDGTPSFERMVRSSRAERLPQGVRARTFRVRFSKANQFAGVPKPTLDGAEREISRATGLRPNRLGADVEYWYMLRAEGGGFFGLLLEDSREPKPEKGELKPSLAAIIAQFAGVKHGDTVLDPFAGHGALPFAATRIARGVKPICVELDRSLMPFLEKRFAKLGTVARGDARSLDLADASVDIILADPPWGVFREAGEGELESLYRDSLIEMARVLKPDGRIAFLTARGFDLEPLLPQNFEVIRSADTLVGGKKATVRVLARRR